MKKRRYMKIAFCVVAALVAVLSVVVVPCSAHIGSEPYSSFWAVDAFPYIDSESVPADVKNVSIFYGTELYREGWSESLAVNPLTYGWYQMYEGTAYSNYSYPQVLARIGGEWVDVTNIPVGSFDYDVHAAFTLHAYDGTMCLDGGSSPLSHDMPLTYGDYFSCALTGYFTDAMHCAPNKSYCVRWSAVSDGVRQKFAYICNTVYEHQIGSGSVSDAFGTVEFLGQKGHPTQVHYWASSAGDNEWQADIDRLTAEKSVLELQITQLQGNIARLEDEKAVAYEEGYQKGLIDNGSTEVVYVPHDYIIDDSSAQSTVVSFIAICFRGIRDFFAPFFAIEFLGFSVFEIAAVAVVGSFVLGVVFFILKFIRG